ncbi:chromosome partitioning protein ParB [Shewanella sp. 5_MG-2023]|uniref:chromosome partitioning protein ParB n=1 Tax=Shewanella sp. 5_MG-2023 TaxID=3062656 RepID=UPI0026E144A2|nr:chromosome partitioning protein ParB [Shewanella sp. 5_MG-2023]MDO6640554.1 chromosome partitioning protein ParB [Shewanella sp. 5_MG-2023]
MENDKVNSFEEDLVCGLVKKYQPVSRAYLGSSKELKDGSQEFLSRDDMNGIFKEKSCQYPCLKRIKTSIRYDVVYITPSVARDILRFSSRGVINPHNKNRRISKAEVKRYTAAMNDEKWCLTGEPIVFSDDGELLNGHTRLESAANSSKGFITVIIYGVTDDLSFAHIDVGKIRSRAQVLEMAGVTVDASILSKVAMLAKSFEQTKNPYAFRGTQGTSFQQAEILEYVEAKEELALSVNFVAELAKRHKREIQAAIHIYAFAHYLIKSEMLKYEGVIAITPEDYLLRLISGIGIQSEEDIEYQVRNFLQTQVGESSSYALVCRLSSIFKGWNHYHNIDIAGNKIAVRRVARYKKDADGNRMPAKSAGNINEAFTYPFAKKGPTPSKIRKQSNLQIV